MELTVCGLYLYYEKHITKKEQTFVKSIEKDKKNMVYNKKKDTKY